MAKTIAIIGAGCAGLGAAAKLMEDFSIRAVLIEANDWIGGRAKTSTDPANLPVDLGPQFIQDPNANPWVKIAEALGYKKGVDLLQPVKGSIFRVFDGETWSNGDPPGIEEMNERLEEEYEIASGFKNRPIMTGNSPVFCRGQQDIRLSLGSSGYGAIAESVEPWQYVAADKDRQDDVIDGGENIYVKGGIGTLVEKFGKKLLADNAQRLMLLQLTVLAIREGKDGVTVTTSDGKSVRYDYCILTIPCAEVEKIDFQSGLPGARRRADGFIRLGSYKKVAFRPTKFPVGDEDEISSERDSIEVDYDYYIYKAPGDDDEDDDDRSDDDQSDDKDGKKDSKDDKKDDGKDDKKDQKKDDDDDDDDEDDDGDEDADKDGVWQYFRLPTDPTILICVAAGDFARRLDDMDDEDVSASVIALLTKAYPNTQADFTPQGDEVVVTNWTETPHIHGAYSYTRYDDRLGADNPIPFEAREIIGDSHGRLHFAGEATWLAAYGTIHGAYESGRETAIEVLEAIAEE